MASAIGTVQVAQRLGPAIGPIVGGVIAPLVGLRATFFVAAAIYLVAVLIIAVVYREPRTRQARAASRGLREVFRELSATPGFWMVFAVILGLQLVDRSFGPILPLYVERQVPAAQVPFVSGVLFSVAACFAALGHLRGGPAKVAVVTSGLNGMISGSSVSNVVSGGIFTIPLMKKSGYGGVKAGAIETMSSVNGQIMPPVMGAAAFLMVEYVGIPYSEIVRNAILPAALSYIGLLYIVHLEALKLGMNPVVRREPRPWRERMLRLGIGLSGSAVAVGALYYLLTGLKALLGGNLPARIDRGHDPARHGCQVWRKDEPL
jgi:TRAP-type C4-dicarboxylate transport system permease large subunit